MEKCMSAFHVQSPSYTMRCCVFGVKVFVRSYQTLLKACICLIPINPWKRNLVTDRPLTRDMLSSQEASTAAKSHDRATCSLKLLANVQVSADLLTREYGEYSRWETSAGTT